MGKLKLSLFVAVLFATTSLKAQKNEWLFGLSKDSARLLANDVVSSFGAYTYESQTEFTDNYKANFLELLYKNSDTNYSVYFQRFNTRYYIQKLEGSFAEMVTIWQKYIDAGATKESLVNGTVKNIYAGNKELHCLLNKNDGEYSIQFRNIKL